MAIAPKHLQDSPANKARRSTTELRRMLEGLKGGKINPLNTRWYLSRLAAMEPAEIVWRARSAASLPFDWAFSKRKGVPAPRWATLRPALYPVQLHTSGAPMESIRVFD